jgi:hypothetical protein
VRLVAVAGGHGRGGIPVEVKGEVGEAIGDGGPQGEATLWRREAGGTRCHVDFAPAFGVLRLEEKVD